MARYLSPEWVESFDATLRALDLHAVVEAAGAGSLAAADGTFSVVQVVTGVPDSGVSAGGGAGGGGGSQVRVVLAVAGGRASLTLDPSGKHVGTATIVLGYPDALAMAHGELDPADALAAGACGCAVTWPRWWPARTCWWRRPRRSAPTSRD